VTWHLGEPYDLVFVAASCIEGLLYLLPALLLVLCLCCRRHPGERLIRALRERCVGKGLRRGTHRPIRVRREVRVSGPRGGRLIATALAGRAPPVMLAAA
jgi:hypothetical protein